MLYQATFPVARCGWLLTSVLLFSFTLLELPTEARVYADINRKLEATKHAIVYLYQEDADPSKDLPGATGFFCHIQAGNSSTSRSRTFLVTARHSVRNCNRIKIRYVSKDGKEEIVELALKESETLFFPKEENLDLAAILVNQENVVAIDGRQILDLVGLKKYGISDATKVICIGYSKNNPGFAKMYPVMRFGRIVSLNYEAWHKEGSTRSTEYAYLVDMHLSLGSSGSPVIIEPQGKRFADKRTKNPVLVLGIVKGAPETLERPQEPHPEIRVSQAVTCVEPGQLLKSFLCSILN